MARQTDRNSLNRRSFLNRPVHERLEVFGTLGFVDSEGDVYVGETPGWEAICSAVTIEREELLPMIQGRQFNGASVMPEVWQSTD